MNKIVIGNLKMNLLSLSERSYYLESFKKGLTGKKLENTEVVLCPPFIHLEEFSKSMGDKAKIGAQNMFWEKEGAFTGEISPVMLKNFGCDYVIVGHSERRRFFSETDEDVNLKVIAALKIRLKTVICIGETKAERDKGETMRVVTRQIRGVLKEINPARADQIIITYEPVWAVGSDVFPTSHEIMEAKVLIKKILVNLFGKRYAVKVKIIYGGSVNAKMAKQVCLDPEMDGVLAGRASLTPHELVKIAEIIDKG